MRFLCFFFFQAEDGIRDADVTGVQTCALPISWGMPYSGWMAGADFLMPGRFLQAIPLCRLITTERPTVSGAVPTIWNDVLQYVEKHPADLSSFRLVACGGSAVPRSLMERFQTEYGVR